MKKLLLVSVVVLLVSCQQPAKENPQTQIGFDITEGVKIPLYAGNLKSVEIWENYIKAHNDRDLEAIKSMNAEKDFKVYGPKGELIEGTEAHIEFLKVWFTDGTNPRWSTKFLIANEFTAKDGSLRQWVTSGHEVTFAVDGNDIKVNQVHDALIVDGKVQKFTVNERILKE